MIEKMKFISLTGPKNDIDRVVDTYLSKYEIHLENALSELSSAHNLMPFIEANPYKEILAKSEDIIKRLPSDTVPTGGHMSASEASELIQQSDNDLAELNEEKRLNQAQRTHLKELLKQIEPYRRLNFDLQKMLEFKFIKIRFGKISHEYFEKFEKYVYENLNTVFYECSTDQDYVWGVYFVPAQSADKVDAIYSSLHFERIIISDECQGTPDEAYQAISSELKELTETGQEIAFQTAARLHHLAGDLLEAHNVLNGMNINYEVRKLAACTKEKSQVFYILCGWLTKKDEKALTNDIKNDPDVYFFTEDGVEDVSAKPPTKLKNPSFFKPFESFIRMYGLPAYNEIDPTIFLSITYAFMFGMMFGDAGQGFLLLVGGFILYKVKKLDLAAIMSFAGFFSTIFGLLYGSIFGYEDLIPTLWVKPMHETMTVLMTAVGFGVFLIIFAMVLNIINGIKARNIGKILFDTNGIAGLIFYVVLIICVVLGFTGHPLPAGIVLAVSIGVPLVIIYFREPLTKLVEKKVKIFPEHKAMFFMESFFELFEILLSFVTNTVSFVRVGAFALSHAGMMEVVLMLGKATESKPNFLIIILGNLFVAGLEGLIVGIQVLRLEYYEMFSRFYTGTGREFKPFKVNEIKK